MHNDGVGNGSNCSMIGTRGLGDEVLLGLQQLNVGKATEAGLAIVLLAIVLDRITSLRTKITR